MAKHVKAFTLEPWGTLNIHFHSWLAGRMAGAKQGAVTLGPNDTYVSEAFIRRDVLAEEFYHARVEAVKRGIGYLPWVLLGYIRKGYTHSKAEKEAQIFVTDQAWRFPAEIRCEDD